MKIYHLTYDHQYQGADYGLFKSLAAAEEYLKNHLKVNIVERRSYYDNTVFIYADGYRIEEKSVG